MRKPADDLNKQIKGFANLSSVNVGDNISFHVTVDTPQTFTIELFRLGHYSGSGARLITTIGPLDGVTQDFPPIDPATGYVEYDWPAAHQMTIPGDWTSGIYLARLTNEQGFDNYFAFVVRDDSQQADFLFQRSNLTDHAYNNFPNVDPSTPGFDPDNPAHIGKSVYEFNSGGGNTVANTPRGVRVSLNRPMSGNGIGLMLTWEYDLLRWLEMEGYDLTYSANEDTDRNPARLLDVKGFISPAHDEYWTGAMYTAAEQARDAGVDLAFMGANSVYWQIRLEPDGEGNDRRTMVAYKWPTIDPEPDPAKKTIKFRDVGRAEQALIGIQYGDHGPDERSDLVPQNLDHWIYDGTNLTEGDVIPAIVGSEVDRLDSNFPLPVSDNQTLLAASPYAGSRGSTTQHTSIYQAPSGAWVFASGTFSWGWGLIRPGHVSPELQQMTRNLLTRFLDDSGNGGGGAGDPHGFSVRLRGTTGEERVRIYTEAGATITEFSVDGTEWQTVTDVAPIGAQQVYVGFVNDSFTAAGDRNLAVDYLRWEAPGEVVQAEAVESKGVWNGTDCGQGFRGQELLACNGWFRFAVPEGGGDGGGGDGGGGGSETVELTVTARGWTGEELISLEIDGQVVTEWRLSTTSETYRHEHTGNAPEVVRVLFTNDAFTAEGDRNVAVDRVDVGTQTFDPIDVRSKGVWNGTDCGIGFRNSRSLACNGWFEFIVNDNPEPPSGANLKVRVRGATGSEQMMIEADGRNYGPFNVGTAWEIVDVDLDAEQPARIRAHFINDGLTGSGADRNLVIDWLELDGVRSSAATLTARGVWDGSRCDIEAVHGTGFLACNGWVELQP